MSECTCGALALMRDSKVHAANCPFGRDLAAEVGEDV